MIQGWENYEPSPIEYFHSELIEYFHQFREGKVGEKIEVELHGGEFNEIVRKAKTKVYEKYSKLNLEKPIEKTTL